LWGYNLTTKSPEVQANAPDEEFFGNDGTEKGADAPELFICYSPVSL